MRRGGHVPPLSEKKKSREATLLGKKRRREREAICRCGGKDIFMGISHFSRRFGARKGKLGQVRNRRKRLISFKTGVQSSKGKGGGGKGRDQHREGKRNLLQQR